MAGESLLALATLAGRILVDAAVGDEWETAQHGYAQLLGRGDAKLTWLAERRLKDTRKQLIGAAAADAGLIRKALAVGWAEWLVDLLGEHPDAGAELKALVQEIQAVARDEMPPDETPSASNHAVSAEGVVSTEVIGEPEHEVAALDDTPSESAEPPPPEHEVSANDDALINATRALAPEHPGTLAARSELAYSIGQAGDAAAARDQFAALVPVAERVLGPEHPDTLAARASLAYWTA
jgi:hypothetical protein